MRKVLPLFAIIAAAFFAWYFNLAHYLSLDTLRTHGATLTEFVHAHYAMAMLFYSLTYIAVVALSIPGAAIMTITGGFLFGQIPGTFIVVISATVGACLLFLSTRLASEDWINQRTGPWIQKMKAGFQENALSYLLTLRLIPLFPFVAVNLGAALLQIPLRTFIIGTFLGIIPGSFVYVSIGVAFQAILKNPNFSLSLALDRHVLLALVGLGVLAFLPAVYRLWKSKSSRPNAS